MYHPFVTSFLSFLNFTSYVSLSNDYMCLRLNHFISLALQRRGIKKWGPYTGYYIDY